MSNLTEVDHRNLLAVIDYGFKNNIVQSQDHAKVLLILEDKLRKELEPATPEATDGDNVPASD